MLICGKQKQQMPQLVTIQGMEHSQDSKSFFNFYEVEQFNFLKHYELLQDPIGKISELSENQKKLEEKEIKCISKVSKFMQKLKKFLNYYTHSHQTLYRMNQQMLEFLRIDKNIQPDYLFLVFQISVYLQVKHLHHNENVIKIQGQSPYWSLKDTTKQLNQETESFDKVYTNKIELLNSYIDTLQSLYISPQTFLLLQIESKEVNEDIQKLPNHNYLNYFQQSYSEFNHKKLQNIEGTKIINYLEGFEEFLKNIFPLCFSKLLIFQYVEQTILSNLDKEKHLNKFHLFSYFSTFINTKAGKNCLQELMNQQRLGERVF